MPPRKSTKRSSPTDIRAECFILCDAARVENGKLYVLGGGWDRMTPEQLPLHFSFQLAAKLVLPREAALQHIYLDIDVSDDRTAPVETSLPPLRLKLDDVTQAPSGEVSILLPLELDATLTTTGTYRIHLTVNGEPVAHTSFQVAPPRNPAPSEVAAEHTVTPAGSKSQPRRNAGTD